MTGPALEGPRPATGFVAATLAVSVALSASCSGIGERIGPPTSPRTTAMQTDTPPPVLERGRVAAADGTELFYAKTGQGPAVVFVHGLGGNHAVWFNQVPAFAREHTVVAISQRGFAPSGGGQRKYLPELLVDDLARVMDGLGIERAHIVGQSMGGWTALGMALWHPERVRSIVIADSLAGISDDAIADHFTAMMRQAREFANAPTRLGVHPAVDAQFAAREPEHAYLYQALSMFGAPSPARIGPQLGAFGFDHAALAGNRIPALFVVGSRDAIFAPSVIRKASVYLAGSKVIEIEDTGHSPYFENPIAWNAIVIEFLRSANDARAANAAPR